MSGIESQRIAWRLRLLPLRLSKAKPAVRSAPTYESKSFVLLASPGVAKAELENSGMATGRGIGNCGLKLGSFRMNDGESSVAFLS